MTAFALTTCARCGAVLSAWESSGCSCNGPRFRTNREVLYAVACSVSEPLHARDFVRIAERDHRVHLGTATAVATLAPDPRFCWAGRGLYGLLRHGPLPGPRNLEQATRVLLVAAGHELSIDVVDFCLKRFGYRYNVASLRNAVAQSLNISWNWLGQWDHARGEQAERELRGEVPIVPQRQLAAWIQLRDRTAVQVAAAIEDRATRLRALGDPARFGMNWEG